MKQLLGILLRRILTGRDHLAGHQVPDLLVQVTGEADIAVGQNADKTVRRLALAIDDRDATDLMRLHQFQRVTERTFGRDRQRVHDHPALIFLDAGDLVGLLVDRHVLVHHTDAAGLRHGDGQPVFRNRIHGRRQKRDFQVDVACQPRGDVSVGRQYGRA